MNQQQIKEKIKEIEKEIEMTEVNPTNYDYYDNLLDIHKKLWDFLYFKKNQEETFLIK